MSRPPSCALPQRRGSAFPGDQAHAIDPERAWRAWRLAAYRCVLQAGVLHRSALLDAVVETDGVRLDRVAGRLRPPAGWLRPGTTDRARDPHAIRHMLGKGWPGWREGEVVVRRSGHPLGRLGLLVADSCLHVVASLDRAFLHTVAGACFVELLDDLPETLKAGAVGRRADALFDHRWFAGRDWTVAAVRQGFCGPTLEIDTGVVPHLMPWADRRLSAAPFVMSRRWP